MRRITAASVPVARRQLLAEPAKLAATVLAVAAAVALVLLLTGLRRGIEQQVTLYLDRQAPVLVGQAGSRDFLSQTSVLPDRTVQAVARIRGVASVTAVDQEYAMLRLHGKQVLALLVGYAPGRGGGPWRVAAGRPPARRGEVVLDRVLAGEHGLDVGKTLDYRGARLRVVGLSSGTTAFMTPLAFTMLATMDGLRHRRGSVDFLFVEPRAGIAPETLARRITAGVPGVSARTRAQVRANDQRQFSAGFGPPLLAMVAVAAAVAALVVALSVMTSTSERRREYATLKALGVRGRRLVRLAVEQALAITLAGAGLGIVLALLAARLVEAVAPRYLLTLSPATAAVLAVAAVVIAALAGALPARYLARLDPAGAFRS